MFAFGDENSAAAASGGADAVSLLEVPTENPGFDASGFQPEASFGVGESEKSGRNATRGIDAGATRRTDRNRILADHVNRSVKGSGRVFFQETPEMSFQCGHDGAPNPDLERVMGFEPTSFCLGNRRWRTYG